MKKIIALLLILPVFALAEPADLSDMSLADLIELQAQVNAAMWKNDQWRSVTVPAGLYEIGADIPTGKWHISLAEEAYATELQITLGKKLSKNMNALDISDFENYYSVFLYSSDIGGPTSIDLTLAPGYYINFYGSDVVFTRSTGPNFTFE